MQNNLRIAVFFDGNYMDRISTYYKFNHPKKKKISFHGLINFVRNYISDKERIELSNCHCVESHWFRGKVTTNHIKARYPDDAKRLSFYERERIVNDYLMSAGVIQHQFPVQVHATGEWEEKGIDVSLSNEAIELAYLKRFDVLALVACDTDFVPMIRKLIGLGTRVMILGWDYSDIKDPDSGKVFFKGARVSQKLIDECNIYVPMSEIIDSRDKSERERVEQIFI